MTTLTPEEFAQRYGQESLGQFVLPPKEDGYLSRVKQDVSSRFGEAVESQTASMEKRLNPFSAGANIAKNTSGIVLSPITQALAPVFEKTLQPVSEAIVNNPTYQKLIVDPLSKANPTALGTASDVLETGLNVAGIEGTTAQARAIPGQVKNIVSRAQNVSQQAQIKTTPVLEQLPANTMQRVARISKQKQANFERRAGQSVGEYLTTRGIWGDIDKITTQLFDRFSRSKGVADESLAKLPGTYNPAPVKTMLSELLGRETRVSTEGAPSPNIARVRLLDAKMKRGGLTMSEINEIKRLYERNVKLDFLKTNQPESVAKANNLDTAVREWQFKQADILGLQNLRAINRETMLAKQLLDDLGREYSGSAGNNAVTITDWIMLSGGDPAAIAGFLAKKTFSSKGVQSAVAQKIYGNRPVQGIVQPKMGPSKVPQLPAPKDPSMPPTITRPINQPSPKAIRSGTEQVPRSSGNTTPPQPQPQQKVIQSPSKSSSTNLAKKQGPYPKPSPYRQKVVEKVYKQGSYTGKDAKGRSVFGGKVKQGKRMDIVIGPPAAGKSELFANPLSKRYQSLIVDSDMVKQHLKGFGKGKGAEKVHRASSDLAEGVLLFRALSNGDNVVLPMIGRSQSKLAALAQMAKDYGYDVHLTLNHVSPEVSLARAEVRAGTSGRVVPKNYILNEVGDRPLQNYQTLRAENSPLFKSYTAFSNEGPVGSSPKVMDLTANSRVVKEVAKKAMELTQKNGGVTIKLNGDIPKNGFSVADSKLTEAHKPIKQAKIGDVVNYVRQNLDSLLKSEDRHLGLWVDNGELYFDIPLVLKDKSQAIKIGKQADQLGIYDIENFETIRLDKDT